MRRHDILQHNCYECGPAIQDLCSQIILDTRSPFCDVYPDELTVIPEGLMTDNPGPEEELFFMLVITETN